MERRIRIIRHLAQKHGWVEVDHQESIGMLSFAKDNMKTNVYYTKMTVATTLTHPKLGRNQMFRRNVKMGFLSRIFKYPRIHTNLDEPNHGYHLKKHKEVV